MRTLVVVGACYLDTILHVSHYPHEDEKLRASSLTRRRGGNGPNTLEVLEQFFPTPFDTYTNPLPLSIIAVLPSRSSPATTSIRASLGPLVDWSHCIYREDHSEPAASFIVKSAATASRTIVNYNALPEMTAAEFFSVAARLEVDAKGPCWFHFEGRIPDVTYDCMRWIRGRFGGDARISVEVEKPSREGLRRLASEADVVFYSRSWAQSEGYQSAKDCLLGESRLLEGSNLMSRKLAMFCTWGEHGASALSRTGEKTSVEETKASKLSDGPVIDTIGAGDTFIAGALYALIFEEDNWRMREILQFANDLAGLKVTAEGFQNLAEKIPSLPR